MNNQAKNNLIVFSVFTLVVIFSMVFIFAAHTVTPTNFYIEEDNQTIFNITINNNDTGGAANITQINITIPSVCTFVTGTNNTNDTVINNGDTFTNTTNVLSWTNFSTNGFVLGSETVRDFSFNLTCSIHGNHNIVVTTLNATGTFSTTLTVEVNSTHTAPNVTTPSAPVNYGNYSGNLLLNFSIEDGFGEISYVFFNVTNASNTENGTFVASNYTTTQWNATIDTTQYPDGTYNITVWANDTVGNMNKSVTIHTLTFDNTKPVVGALTSVSATTSSVSFSSAVSDATTDVSSSACTVDRGGATITGTGTRTISESGLDCGHTYEYTVTCTDSAGNNNYATASFKTSLCGGSGSSSGPSATTWTSTYAVSSEQFTEGYTKELSSKNRMKFKIGNVYHHVGVKSITATKATIEIASDPLEIILEVGQDAKVDLDEDGVYDLYVVLNGIENNKADLTVQSLDEVVPEGEDVVTTTGEIVIDDEEVVEEEGFDNWGIIVIIILVLAVAVGGGVAWKKKR